MPQTHGKQPRYTFTTLDDDGEEVEVSLPAKYEVCDRCRGTGVHDHPAFANGISQEAFREDPDFAEDYRAGHYDVSCKECGGERVVAVPDMERLTPEQKELLEGHCDGLAVERQERRMRERGIHF